jgi:hypothetical protein
LKGYFEGFVEGFEGFEGFLGNCGFSGSVVF